MRPVCWWLGIWGTLSDPGFWRSLWEEGIGGGPTPIVTDGHLWPYPTEWSLPEPSPDPPAWPGAVEYKLLNCNRCGLHRNSDEWRPYYGTREA